MVIYQYKLHTILLALLFTLSLSCSKRQVTNAKIVISGLSLLESQSDLTISGVSDDEDYFSIVINSGVSSTSITIPTGSWQFYGFHFNSNQNSKCSYIKKEITGDLQNVNLDYSSDTCGLEIFGDVNNSNKSSGFNKLKIYSCNDLSSISENDSTCGESNIGLQASYEVSIPSVELSNINSPILGEDKISLGCFNINEEGYSISGHRLPIGNESSLPFTYDIHVYSSRDCEGNPSILRSDYSLHDLESDGVLRTWATTYESETYSTVFFQNKLFENGLACSTDNQCVSSNCENLVCQSIKCEDTEISNSNYSETGSLSGRAGDALLVTCDEGYSGGGSWSCSESGSWQGQNCERDGFVYIGCFTDQASRAMSARLSNTANWETMSEEELASACNIECQGYDYFGIEHQSECFCDNTYDSYGEGITLTIEQLESGLRTESSNRGSGHIGYCAEDKTLNNNIVSNWALKVYQTESIDCPASSVAHSDYSASGSLTGSYNDPAITVTCDNEYTGGGSWTCDSSGSWTGHDCTPEVNIGVCGNGVVEGTESCDDGNTTTELACDYGIGSCSACNSDCSATLALSGSYCRDGTPDFTEGEECDTGGATTSCNADCTVNNSNAFISAWDVSEGDKSITIPTNSDLSYDYIINWGDGNSEKVIDSQSPVHVYTAAGSYTVTISGTFPAIVFNNTGDKDKISSISNLGNVGWTSFENAFYGCSNLGSVSGGVTDHVTSLQNMFRAATNATPDTSDWDTSSVTNMSGTFMNADSSNPTVTNWDTSSVTDMSLMFRGADIATPTTTGWNVSSVTDMTGMFRNAPHATPNTSSWNVSSVTTMKEMFKEADLANPDTSSWVTTSLTSTEAMFQDAAIANPDTSSWDTSSITTMRYMFDGATSANPDTRSWTLASISITSHLESILNQSGIDDKNYSRFLVMAESTSNINAVDLGTIPASYSEGVAATARGELTKASASGGHSWSITDEGSTGVNSCSDSVVDTFFGEECDTGGDSATCTATCTIKTEFVTTWELTGGDPTITLPLIEEDDGGNLFTYNFEVCWGDDVGESETCANVTSYDDPDRSFEYNGAGEYTVTISGTMETIKFGDSEFADERGKLIEVNNLGDVGWTSFEGAFHGCTNLTTVSSGDTSEVTNMALMFFNATNAAPDTSGWDTSNVVNMRYLFQNAKKATPDTSGWDTSKVTTMLYMFGGATEANPDTSGWDTSNVETMIGMFQGASKANPDTSEWDTSKVERMDAMFATATIASPDTSNWSLESLNHFNALLHIFKESGISSENYSKFLIMAESTAIRTGVDLGDVGDGSVDYYTGDAADAKDELIDIGWSFTDGEAVAP